MPAQRTNTYIATIPMVNEQTTIELLDGTSINLRPLKISLLREFMKKFEEIVYSILEDIQKYKRDYKKLEVAYKK